MHSHSHRKRRAFTLLELIVAISIIVVLFAVVTPRLTGTSPRKTAVLSLKAALETARSEAIRRRTEVYVAFLDGSDALDPEERYRKYAIFYRERPTQDLGDDGNDPFDRYLSDQLSCPTNELISMAGWQELPQGILLAMSTDTTTGPDIEVRSGERAIFTMLDNTTDGVGNSSNPRRMFPHPDTTSPDLLLPFCMFNEDGRLQFPQFFATEFHYLGVVEALYDAGASQRIYTSTRPGIEDSSTDYPLSELLHINLYSGRVRLLSESF